MNDPWADVRELFSTNGKWLGESPDDVEIYMLSLLTDADALLAVVRATRAYMSAHSGDTRSHHNVMKALVALPEHLRKEE